MNSQVSSIVSQYHPEEDNQDQDGDFANVIETVKSWNKHSDKFHYIECLAFLGRVKQNVAKMS